MEKKNKNRGNTFCTWIQSYQQDRINGVGVVRCNHEITFGSKTKQGTPNTLIVTCMRVLDGRVDRVKITKSCRTSSLTVLNG